MDSNNVNNAGVKTTNVQVAVRCRPLNGEERKTGQPSVITCDTDAKTIKVSYGPAGKKQIKPFTFDRVFGMYSTQEEVFEQMVRPIVDEALAGFNCTIFAYGQTGTGKTHTMEGDINSEESAGIVPRSVRAILEQLEGSGSEFTIRVSFLELYNEELQDLLNTTGEKKLKLCEDIKKGVVCQNLEEITVLSVKDIFEILQRGIQQRQTAATLCNKNSSRSHSIFTMKIMIKECNVEGEEVVRHGQLNLVDLAGSECVGRSGAKNDRAREAGSINQSLLTLGRVITALVDHHGHIPYRDSKLTRLLQESLGGKAKTCIIATLSPSQLAIEESMSTLDYAHRAKNIKNQPTLNQRMTKKVVMKEYCAEIESLKVQLQLTREKNGVYVDPEEFYNMENRLATQEAQLCECEAALRSKVDEVKFLRADREAMASELDSLQAELKTTEAALDDLSNLHAETKVELASTQVELQASEAVVGEQVLTEEELHFQGDFLQQEVAARRRDVEGLFAKVNRFADLEKDRLQRSSNMLSDVKEKKFQMDTATDQFVKSCQEESLLLENGVVSMLEKSRGTCQALRRSIDDALTTLIDDATRARDSMTASCDGLSTHLQETNSHICITLGDVKEKLSSWLGEVDLSMNTAKEQLKIQGEQIQKLSSSVAQTASAYEAASTEFIGSQKLYSESFHELSNEISFEMVRTVNEFNESTKRRNQEAERELKSQAAAIQETFQQMMGKLVEKSMANFAVEIQSSENLCKELSKSTFSRVQGLQTANDANRAASENKIKNMLSQIKNGSEQHVSTLFEIGAHGSKASRELEKVCGSVGSKRAFLDSTVSTLSSHVTAAIEQGRAVVVETSETANTTLSDISRATTQMTTSADNSLQDFKMFLDGTGESISSGLKLHFEGLSNYQERCTCALDDLVDGVLQHGKHAIDTQLRPTGSTPKKCKYDELPVLAKTKEHDEIKRHVREALGAATPQCPPTLEPLNDPVDCDEKFELNTPIEEDNSPRVATSSDVPNIKGENEGISEVDVEMVDAENLDPNELNMKVTATRRSKVSTRSKSSSGKSKPTATVC